MVVEEELCNEAFFPHKSRYDILTFFFQLFNSRISTYILLASFRDNFALYRTGADQGFFRARGADFQKNFENFEDLFFFTKRSLFSPNFLRRRQIFEKTGQS